MLRTHKLSRLVNASAQTRKLSDAPLTSRASALWLRVYSSIRALKRRIGSHVVVFLSSLVLEDATPTAKMTERTLQLPPDRTDILKDFHQ